MRRNILFLVFIMFVLRLQSQDYKDIIKIEFNTLTRTGISNDMAFTKDSIIFKSIDNRSQEIISYKAKS